MAALLRSESVPKKVYPMCMDGTYAETSEAGSLFRHAASASVPYFSVAVELIIQRQRFLILQSFLKISASDLLLGEPKSTKRSNF